MCSPFILVRSDSYRVFHPVKSDQFVCVCCQSFNCMFLLVDFIYCDFRDSRKFVKNKRQKKEVCPKKESVCKKQRRENLGLFFTCILRNPYLCCELKCVKCAKSSILACSKSDSLAGVACTSHISYSATKCIRILCGWLLGSTISRLQISAPFAIYIPHPNSTKQPRMCNPRLVFA